MHDLKLLTNSITLQCKGQWYYTLHESCAFKNVFLLKIHADATTLLQNDADKSMVEMAKCTVNVFSIS